MNKILELEKRLFKEKYLSNQNYLDSIFDDDYKEIGKSGRMFKKKDEMEHFKNDSKDRNIIIYNYSEEKIGNIYLVHYITKDNDNLIYRTSIWKEKETIKLYFHQAL